MIPYQVPGHFLAGLPLAWADRLRVQDRGQHAIGIAGLRGTGQEVGDLDTQRVAVSAGGEPQRVITGLLEVAGASYVRGQVAAVAGRRDAVSQTLDHQRGHVNRG